jgi:mRNA-degrading endonuclease RelE of RelBE toxin-antitoxin system
MVYKVVVNVRAQKEIEEAINFYDLYSDVAPIYFITALKNAYNFLELNPFYRIRYKNVRAIKLRRFPFNLYFTVNEEQGLVTVLSCFHNKRNPKKRPKL